MAARARTSSKDWSTNNVPSRKTSTSTSPGTPSLGHAVFVT